VRTIWIVSIAAVSCCNAILGQLSLLPFVGR